MSGNKKEEEMICALTADEQCCAARGLRSCRIRCRRADVWHRIREQAEAEGLIKEKVRRSARPGMPGVGLAAAAWLLAIMLPGLLTRARQTLPVVRTVSARARRSSSNTLQTLMTESRELESNLRALPDAAAGAARRHGGDDLGPRGPDCSDRLPAK